MIFGKPGYNLIGTEDDPYPKDEPAFLLRAQDVLAPKMLKIYAVLCEEDLHDYKLASRVREHLSLMLVWPTKKRPD